MFDLKGREVEKIINGYIESGHYEINWNASRFSSGVYFLQMETGKSSITRKMILMK